MRICIVCGNAFVFKKRQPRQKYCSRACYAKSKIGHIPWNKGLKGMKPWMNISGLKTFGKTSWNKGKHFSSESKRKMSISQKARFRDGHKHPMTGRTHSDETKRRWSENRKGKDNRKPETIQRVRMEWGRRRGPEVPTWKGGVTKVQRAVRAMDEYVTWRKRVFERDSYTCQKCGLRGRLNADHIIPFSTILSWEGIQNIDDARSCEFLWDIENGRTLCESCHKASPTTKLRELHLHLFRLKNMYTRPIAPTSQTGKSSLRI